MMWRSGGRLLAVLARHLRPIGGASATSEPHIRQRGSFPFGVALYGFERTGGTHVTVFPP